MAIEVLRPLLDLSITRPSPEFRAPNYTNPEIPYISTETLSASPETGHETEIVFHQAYSPETITSLEQVSTKSEKALPPPPKELFKEKAIMAIHKIKIPALAATSAVLLSSCAALTAEILPYSTNPEFALWGAGLGALFGLHIGARLALGGNTFRESCLLPVMFAGGFAYIGAVSPEVGGTLGIVGNIIIADYYRKSN